jgi:peptidoglycan/xylan/chitin deacetylase (PgdA/CDA1 family)
LDTSKYENIKLFELKNLIDRDHIIGAHTRSHKKLSKIKHESELKDEIINAADELEEKLKYKIKNFAYTFGDIKSINKSSIELATKRFDYIFSGLRGNNIKNNKIVTREAVNFFSDLKLNHAILNGFYDFLYKKKLNKLEKWV